MNPHDGVIMQETGLCPYKSTTRVTCSFVNEHSMSVESFVPQTARWKVRETAKHLTELVNDGMMNKGDEKSFVL